MRFHFGLVTKSEADLCLSSQPVELCLVKVLLCCTWWQWFGWWWQVFPWCRCWPVISAVTGDNNLIIVSPLILCSAELQFLHWQNISNCCQWHKTLSVTHRFNVLLLDLYLLSLLHSVLWICSDFFFKLFAYCCCCIFTDVLCMQWSVYKCWGLSKLLLIYLIINKKYVKYNFKFSFKLNKWIWSWWIICLVLNLVVDSGLKMLVKRDPRRHESVNRLVSRLVSRRFTHRSSCCNFFSQFVENVTQFYYSSRCHMKRADSANLHP